MTPEERVKRIELYRRWAQHVAAHPRNQWWRLPWRKGPSPEAARITADRLIRELEAQG